LTLPDPQLSNASPGLSNLFRNHIIDSPLKYGAALWVTMSRPPSIITVGVRLAHSRQQEDHRRLSESEGMDWIGPVMINQPSIDYSTVPKAAFTLLRCIDPLNSQ
jgi:hypothetical protein